MTVKWELDQTKAAWVAEAIKLREQCKLTDDQILDRVALLGGCISGWKDDSTVTAWVAHEPGSRSFGQLGWSRAIAGFRWLHMNYPEALK